MIDEKKLIKSLEKQTFWAKVYDDEDLNGVEIPTLLCLGDVIATVMDLLEEHSGFGEWIPVSVELPTTGMNVLVCDNEKFITRGCYLDYEDDTEPSWVTDADEGYYVGKIVAWMPLPAPYEVKDVKD